MSHRLMPALLLLFVAETALAQSLDGEVKDLVTAIRAKDGIAAQESLLGAAVALDRIQRTIKPFNDAVGIISKATKTLSGEPSELDDLVESIQKDTKKIDAIRPVAPPFGNPLSLKKYPDLESPDPATRGTALGKLRADSDEMRDQYSGKLNEMVSGRDNARRLLQQAETANDNGIKVEKILDDLNESNAGLIFNIGGARLAYTLLEMSVFVRPALQLRENACRELVTRYDTAIDEMRRRLDRFRSFDQWTSFYMWQDWVRVNLHAKPQSVNEQMNEATALAKQADALGRNAQSNGTTAWLLSQTVANTSATMDKAQALLDQAHADDEKAASLREISALVQLASLVDSASSNRVATSESKSRQPLPTPPQKASIPKTPPIIIFQTTTIEFKLVPNSQQTPRTP